jgi:hypothetical protein
MIDYFERIPCAHFDQQDIFSPARPPAPTPITRARRCFPKPTFISSSASRTPPIIPTSSENPRETPQNNASFSVSQICHLCVGSA